MPERPLGILHLLSYPWFTGPAEPVLTLALVQQRRGHRVAFACDTEREGDLVQRAEEAGLPVERRLSLCAKSGPILLLRDVLALKRLWREGEFDILHAHRSHDHTLAALARTRHSPTRLVRTLHTERALSPRRSFQLRRADGLITVARRDREALLRRCLLPPERVVSIEGVVDAERFSPGSGERVRQEVGLAPDAPVALLLARMVPGRGHAELIEAFASIHRGLPGAHLMLAGRGPLEAELRERVHQAGLDETVRFIGYRRDLPQVYRSADVVVLLSPGNDGTCRAALEAMACGKPMVVSDRGALPEIVRDHETGRVVPAGDVRALANTLGELLADHATRERMGRAAREEAQTRFTPQRAADRVEELYRVVLAKADGRRC
ncbi:MAG: glycosyltransferase family 4 protein [Myxococcales bacterium]|nr:glycosyltransferase family 4 protein [Myxococcales bacterium]